MSLEQHKEPLTPATHGFSQCRKCGFFFFPCTVCTQPLAGSQKGGGKGQPCPKEQLS